MFQDSSLSAPCLAGPILVERMVNAWMLFTNNPWWLSHNPHDHVILKSFCWARVLGSKAFRVWTRMAWLRLLLKITKKQVMACYGRKMDPKENRVPGAPGTSHCVWARITISTYRLPGNTLVPQWLHHLKSGEVLLVKVPILSTPCGCPPRYAPWRWKLLLGVLAQGGSPPNSLGLCDDCCFQCGWYINKNPKLHTRWQPQITVLRWLFVNPSTVTRYYK